MRRTLTALFEDYEAAAETVRRLENAGLSYRDISLIAGAEGKRHLVAQGSTEDGSQGAGGGAAAGGVIGGGIGLAAGLGLIAVPGLGPMVAAGWLAATLTGAAAGAATGGLVGVLVNEGLRDSDAEVYAAGLKRGGTLVVLRVDEADLAKARAVLAASPARDLAPRTRAPRPAGWSAGVPSAPAERSLHPMIRAGRIKGTTVYDRNGTPLGKVDQVMLDKQSGKVVHVLVSAGAMFGTGGEPAAVQWDALDYDPHLEGYRLNLTEDEFRRRGASLH